MKCAIWLRVSTQEQHTENQLPALEALAQRRGLEVARVYEAEASAWKGAHQKLLSQVYQDARLGEFNVLIIWALDRISREGVAPTFEIINRLARSGVKVISVMEAWTEQEGPMYDLLLSVFAWVAQYESQRRSERVKAARKRVEAVNGPWGRPSRTQHVDLDLVGRLKAEGLGWRTIQKQHPLTVPVQATGRKRRPSVTTIRKAWGVCENPQPPEAPISSVAGE